MVTLMTMEKMTIAGYEVNVFTGEESRQVTPNGKPLTGEAYYWEPLDYEGDVVFAGPFATLTELCISVEEWAAAAVVTINDVCVSSDDELDEAAEYARWHASLVEDGSDDTVGLVPIEWVCTRRLRNS